MNRSLLSGRLTADPELRQTPNSVSVTSFSIAVDRSYTPKGGEREVDFIDIVAWRGTAEFICKYFAKGKWIEIDGSIRTRKYVDKQGNNRKAVEVVADSAYFGGAPKDTGTQATGDAAYPPPPPPSAPAGFDPFKTPQTPAHNVPAYVSGNAADFYEPEGDDDGDLPF